MPSKDNFFTLYIKLYTWNTYHFFKIKHWDHSPRISPLGRLKISQRRTSNLALESRKFLQSSHNFCNVRDLSSNFSYVGCTLLFIFSSPNHRFHLVIYMLFPPTTSILHFSPNMRPTILIALAPMLYILQNIKRIIILLLNKYSCIYC